MNRLAQLGLSLFLSAASLSCAASVSSDVAYLQYSGFNARHTKSIAPTKGKFKGDLKQVVAEMAPRGWQIDISPALDGYSRNAYSWNDQGPWTQVLSRFLTDKKIHGLIVWPESRITLGQKPAEAIALQTQNQLIPSVAINQWQSVPGQTLRQTITAWSAKAPCSEAPGWVVIWDSQSDYQIDSPLSFSGSFESLLSQVFDLYKNAEKPLFAQANRTQCVIYVSDQPAVNR